MLTEYERRVRKEAEDRYRGAVRATMSDWNKHQAQQIVKIRDGLAQYRDSIVASMADVTEWDAHRISEVTAMLDRARDQLAQNLTGLVAASGDEIAALALASVDRPLREFGVNVGTVGRQLPIAQVNYLREIAPKLITNVTDQTHEQVRSLMFTHAHGGMTKADLLKKIGNATGPLKNAQMKPGQVIPRAEKRAQTIFRTENNRMASIIQQDRIEQLSKGDPGVGSRWMHWPSEDPRSTHQALHGKVIFRGHGESFEIGGVEITGPHDPKLPADEVINCHCKVVVTYDPDKSDEYAKPDPIIAGAPAGSGATAKTPVVTAKAPKTPRKPKTPKVPISAEDAARIKAEKAAARRDAARIKRDEKARLAAEERERARLESLAKMQARKTLKGEQYSKVQAAGSAARAEGVALGQFGKLPQKMKPSRLKGILPDIPPRPLASVTRQDNIDHINKLLEMDEMMYPQRSDAFFAWNVPDSHASMAAIRQYSDDGVRGLTHILHDIAEDLHSNGTPFITRLSAGGADDSMAMGTGKLTIGSGTKTANSLSRFGKRLVDDAEREAYRARLIANCDNVIGDAKFTGCSPEYIAQLERDRAALEDWDGLRPPRVGLMSVSAETYDDNGALLDRYRNFRADGCVQAEVGSHKPDAGSLDQFGFKRTANTTRYSSRGQFETSSFTFGEGQQENVGIGVPDGWGFYGIRHEIGHHEADVFSYTRTLDVAELNTQGQFLRTSRNSLAHFRRDGGEFADATSKLFASIPGGRGGRSFISHYADYGGRKYSGWKTQEACEWWAENYSAYKQGAMNDVEPAWLDFAREWGVI